MAAAARKPSKFRGETASGEGVWYASPSQGLGWVDGL